MMHKKLKYATKKMTMFFWKKSQPELTVKKLSSIAKEVVKGLNS